MTAEGSVYQRKDGRWVAQYRDARDKVRYIYRKRKSEARKALREVGRSGGVRRRLSQGEADFRIEARRGLRAVGKGDTLSSGECPFILWSYPASRKLPGEVHRILLLRDQVNRESSPAGTLVIGVPQRVGR